MAIATATEQEELTDVDGIAKLLNCTRQHVYVKTRQGELPHFKTGKLIRFSPREVLDALRRQTATSVQAPATLPTRALRKPAATPARKPARPATRKPTPSKKPAARPGPAPKPTRVRVAETVLA